MFGTIFEKSSNMKKLVFCNLWYPSYTIKSNNHSYESLSPPFNTLNYLNIMGIRTFIHLG